ncbi:sigma-70 family RNA polymerase sigma factor (plasmid) [Streptomyces sp. NBC_01717]|uniref:sigma-70 family RNA polymerase sigma factor n=1 Tax=Streptomyces sp. NBC_01717 TaxID=2975918 RepID=UPI002E3266FF|nr:sigma-70 family RNA polymerase sigma factor [Streptomyces sp. NBC_01717]
MFAPTAAQRPGIRAVARLALPACTPASAKSLPRAFIPKQRGYASSTLPRRKSRPGSAGPPAQEPPGAPNSPLTPARRTALLEQVYKDHSHYLRCLVRSRAGGDWELAEDVVQETMLRAWRYAEKFDGGPEFTQAWLTTVAKNLLIDSHRRRQTRPQEVAYQPYLEHGTPLTHDKYADILASMTVEEILPRLSPEHRDVVRLIYLSERSVEEAANQLGIPSGTVKSRLFYALRLMRQILERADARADRAR